VIRELFNKERAALTYFFDKLDISAIEKLVEILKSAPGMIILTGVGKSGLVAEKIALTLTSTGTRAYFLSPINALHGDIGIVSPDDVFIMLSKSGESEELLQMVPFLRNKGVKLVSIVNKENSRLAKASDFSVVLPMERELCHFDLVPTTSAITHMLLGDVLAVALMGLKNFTLVDYAKNHPSGKIGRRLTLRVSDLMLKGDDIPLCSPKDSIVSTLVELSNKKCGCLLVVDKEKRLQGIFTDGDLRRSLVNHGHKALEKTVEEVMTLSPRHTKADHLAEQALKVMEGDQKHPVTVLPVLDDAGTVFGLIKMHDIIQSGL
jgi:arabinose-5-phosphate isomerase